MKKPLQLRNDFSCGGVVLDRSQNKLLLIKVENLSKTVVWTFPKGHPEKGETDIQAALREVVEETGWECRVVESLLDVDYFFVHENVRTHKTVRWFLMEPVKKVGEFNPGEIKGCEWVSPEEAGRLVVYESDHKILKRLGY
jgi:8-oxo-dGTP pyrophosphatase MutT (NUDIX family)